MSKIRATGLGRHPGLEPLVSGLNFIDTPESLAEWAFKPDRGFGDTVLVPLLFVIPGLDRGIQDRWKVIEFQDDTGFPGQARE